MSKKHMESNIDDIFRQGIDPLLTEPSDEFWKKASEGIISRGSQTAGKNASRWRVLAIILAAGVLVLGYLTYRMQGNLRNVEKQIATVKEAKNSIAKKTMAAVATSGSTASLINSTTNSGSISGNNSVSQNNANKSVVALNQQPAKVGKAHYKGTSYSTNNSSQAPLLVAAKPVTQHDENKVSSVDKPISNAQKDPVSQASGDKQTIVTLSQQPATTGQNSTSVPVASNQNSSPAAIVKTTQAPAQASPDSTGYTKADNTSSGKSSRFSISAFFSPNFMTNYKLICNAPNASEMESSIKNEKEGFSYVTGANVAYAISSKVSVISGIGYSSYKFSVPPCNLYAQKQSNGDVGYSVVTSSGLVNCPSYGNTWPGDTLSMNATSTRTYLSIPLLLKYYFNNNPRYRFYIQAGLTANIAIGQSVVMNWKDAWQEHGTTEVNPQGSEQMYFSCSISPGFEYNVWRHFSIYLEPGISNAMTPLDKGTAVISYPRQFNVTGGLTYHF